jgi:hypothetical protein
MKKYIIFNQSDQEVATILIFLADNHKVGIILQVPYVANSIKDAYLLDYSDELIITDLLNKVNLSDVKIQSN